MVIISCDGWDFATETSQVNVLCNQAKNRSMAKVYKQHFFCYVLKLCEKAEEDRFTSI